MRNLFLMFSLAATTLVAFADDNDFNRNTDRLGCGVITSIRSLNQRPLADSRFDYNSANQNASEVGAVLRFVGLGVAATAVGEFAASTAIGAVKASNNEDRIKEEETTKNYKDVVAVKFTFDDGREINLPMPDWSGLRYKPGVRLYAYYAKKHDSVQLSYNALFHTVSSPKDDDYFAVCGNQIDPKIADAVIEKSAMLVDESKITN